MAKGNETVEYACSLPQLAQGKNLKVSSQVSCEDKRVPLGVIASIVPFNFPCKCTRTVFKIISRQKKANTPSFLFSFQQSTRTSNIFCIYKCFTNDITLHNFSFSSFDSNGSHVDLADCFGYGKYCHLQAQRKSTHDHAPSGRVDPRSWIPRWCL